MKRETCILVLPEKEDKTTIHAIENLAFVSIVRAAVLKPVQDRQYVQSARGLVHLAGKQGGAANLATMYLKAFFKSIRLLKIYKWSSTEGKIRFCSDFLRLKKKIKVPAFS